MSQRAAHIESQHPAATAAKLDGLQAAGLDSWKNLGLDMGKMNEAFARSFSSVFQTPGTSERGIPSAQAGSSNTRTTI